MSQLNSWIFALPQAYVIDVICGQSTKTYQISSSGILKIRPGCYLKNEDIRIDAHLVKFGNFTKFYLPKFNLTSNLNPDHIKWHSNANFKFNNDVINNELNNIISSIDDVKSQETFPKLTYHDVHHYTVIYVMLIMLLIAICFLVLVRLRMAGYLLHNYNVPEQPSMLLGNISPNITEQIYSNTRDENSREN